MEELLNITELRQLTFDIALNEEKDPTYEYKGLVPKFRQIFSQALCRKYKYEKTVQ